MKKLTLFILSCALLVPAAYAKNQAGLSEAYGVVRSIDDNQMTVTVIDPKTNETSDMTFALSPETELVIVRPASEVIEGDEIKINYEDGKKEKAAKFISILDLPAPETAQAS